MREKDRIRNPGVNLPLEHTLKVGLSATLCDTCDFLFFSKTACRQGTPERIFWSFQQIPYHIKIFQRPAPDSGARPPLISDLYRSGTGMIQFPCAGLSICRDNNRAPSSGPVNFSPSTIPPYWPGFGSTAAGANTPGHMGDAGIQTAGSLSTGSAAKFPALSPATSPPGNPPYISPQMDRIRRFLPERGRGTE